MMPLERFWVDIIKKRFLVYKDLGEKTFEQLSDEDIHFRNHEGVNSIFIMVKHIHGNMLSRFTDFLTTDGEKSWRKREDEFEDNPKADKRYLLALWNECWGKLLDLLDELEDADLKKEIKIRGETHVVIDALLRQVSHYAYHVGQMVHIGKVLKGADWKSLSIPKGQTVQFNKKMKEHNGK